MRSKRGQLIAGLVLVTAGSLIILDWLMIIGVDISWPLVLVAIGFGLFLTNHHTFAGRIVIGIGVIYFLRNFLIAFFPDIEPWLSLVWPSILVIVGILLLYRYYRTPSPQLPAQPQPPKQEDQEPKPEPPKDSAES
jgi:hypothetical protein